MSTSLSRGLLLALVLTNALWAYLLFDRAVTIQSQADALARQEGRVALLSALLTNRSVGIAKEQFITAVKQTSPDIELKVVGDTVEVDGILGIFEKDALVRVSPM